MESPTKKTFFESFTIGAVSGTLSSFILQPLDMVKTRQQLLPRLSMLQHTKYILRCTAGVLFIPVTVIKTRFESGVYSYNGIFQALGNLLRTEGVRGLTSGLVPTLLRDVPYSDTKTEVRSTTRIKNNVVRHFLCSILAGVAASVVTHPFDVIKTQVQVSKSHLNSVTATKNILKSDGIRGLFVGLAPRLIRRTLMTALSWTLYERIFQYLAYRSK